MKTVRQVGPVRIERDYDLFEVFALQWRGCWRIYFQNAPGWWFLYLGLLFFSWDKYYREFRVEWNPD